MCSTGASKTLYLRRWIHKVEFEQVLDAQTFEEQYRVGQVRTLDFRDRILEHLVPVRHLCVEAITIPGASSSSTSRALIRVRLRNGCDLEGIHAYFRVVHLELVVTRVHNVMDTVD